jgi:predicted ATPase
VLAHDGHDLAAALQTIVEIGDREGLRAALADAFPGASLGIAGTDGYLEVELRQPGLLRPLKAAELSDGTLRYLLLTAALLSPRLPSLMVLNEPETSLHPDLLPALARLIGKAAARTQIIVVSHAQPLVRALANQRDCQRITLVKELSETIAEDEDPPDWAWPQR